MVITFIEKRTIERKWIIYIIAVIFIIIIFNLFAPKKNIIKKTEVEETVLPIEKRIEIDFQRLEEESRIKEIILPKKIHFPENIGKENPFSF